jgi:small subunit ribosomal protein S6
MSDQRIYSYEGMFLFPQAAVANLQAAVDHVREILSRGDAEVLSLFKWDERRLAYEIRGNKRGVYLLAYFRAPGVKMTEIERACRLSETLLRSMVIRADHLKVEQMQNAEREQALADEIKLRGEPGAAEGDREEGGYVDADAGEPQFAGEEA